MKIFPILALAIVVSACGDRESPVAPTQIIVPAPNVTAANHSHALRGARRSRIAHGVDE